MAIKFHGGVARICHLRLDEMLVHKVINKNVRVLYLPKSKNQKHGFDFAVVNFKRCTLDDRDEWKDPSCNLEVSIIAEGVALHDGIRHMYWNTVDPGDDDEDDDLGYLYFPDVKEIADSLIALRELEERYCIDY